jgi:hypothetical protein
MWRRCLYLCFFSLLWPLALFAAQPPLSIFAFSMDEKIAILDKLFDKPVDRKVDDANPLFVFPKGQVSQPLLFQGKFSAEEQQSIHQWQTQGFDKDRHVKICHSFALPEDHYLIITETLFSHACATCPGLLGMAIVRGKGTGFTVFQPHTYVAFSGINGRPDSSEVVKISPTQFALLLEGAEEVKGNGWQTFTLLEIMSLPMQFIERWRYRTQTDNQGICREDICFQKDVVAAPSAHLRNGYFDITVRHKGPELASKETEHAFSEFVHTVDRVETFSFDARTGQYINNTKSQ